MDRLDGGTTKRNGVAINCFIIGLFSGIARGQFRVELNLVIHQINVSEALDDVSQTDIDDVREAHNAVFDVIKVDLPVSEFFS